MKAKLFTLVFLISCIYNVHAAKYYWVGNSGNWNDQNHWSLSSGGVPANAIPAYNDIACFDANSFTMTGQTVTITSFAEVRFLDFSAATFSPEIKGNYIELGGLSLSPSMTWHSDLDLFLTFSGNNTFNTSGIQLGKIKDSFSGISNGSLTLTSDLNCRQLILENGYFYSGGYDINADSVRFTNIYTSLVDLSTSVLTVEYFETGYPSMPPINVKVEVDSAIIIIDNPAGMGRFRNMESRLRYKEVILKSQTSFSNADSLFIKKLEVRNLVTGNFGPAYIDSLILNNGGYSMNMNGTVHIQNAITTNATSSNPLQLSSAFTFYIYKDTGEVCLHNLILMNVHTLGNAFFYAGSTSVDLGGNAGWTFADCSTGNPTGYYWVGDTGSWSNIQHWATSSGGSVFHNTPPGSLDNIFIDTASFTNSTGMIILDAGPFQCKNIYITSDDLFTISSTSTSKLVINNSAVFSNNINWQPGVQVEFKGVNSNDLITGGTVFNGDLIFTNAGYLLKGDLTTTADLYINGTGFNSDNYNISARKISTNHDFDFKSSYVKCNHLSINNAWFSSGMEFTSLEIAGPDTALLDLESGTQLGTVLLSSPANIDLLHGDVTKLIPRKYVNLINDISIDTLILENPGDSVIFPVGLAIEVGGMINNSTGAPVFIGSISGFATIEKSSGQICLQNVNIKNLLATGGAQFYAGFNCTDLGGNAGWQFTPCSNGDVWPGDANYDGAVDNLDVLNIGLAFNESGPVRANASLIYIAQPATDWASSFANLANKKHADTDGNGIIEDADTAAIVLNYGLSHPLRQSTVTSSEVLSTQVGNPFQDHGDTMEVIIDFGNSFDVVDSIYGIAFSLQIDTLVIRPDYFVVDFANGWMGNPSTDLLSFSRNNMTSRATLDFTLTRKDHLNVSGFGEIARCYVIIKDQPVIQDYYPVLLSNVTAVTANENYYTPLTVDDSVVVLTGIQEMTDVNISVYPNPAKDEIKVSADEEIISIQLIDISGRIVYSKLELTNNNSVVKLNSLQDGSYILKVDLKSGTLNRKVIVNRN